MSSPHVNLSFFEFALPGVRIPAVKIGHIVGFYCILLIPAKILAGARTGVIDRAWAYETTRDLACHGPRSQSHYYLGYLLVTRLLLDVPPCRTYGLKMP